MTFEYDSDENVSFLNYMQALKRRDRVSLSKMKRLFEISKDGEPRERFAAKLLLEASDEDVLEAWGEVDDIEKKQLQKFPIFDFVKGSLRQKIS